MPAWTSPEFKLWLGRSVCVNPDGSPMVLCHGTNAKFEFFDNQFIDEHGFFFTNDLPTAQGFGRRVMRCHLRLENPYRCPYSVWMSDDNAYTARLKSLGFDGLILGNYNPNDEPEGAVTVYVAFDAAQIRFAKGARLPRLSVAA